MSDIVSFGLWIKRRRKALDLTQVELARRVTCSLILIQKIEADARRPTREMAAHLADELKLTTDERAAFIQVARMELAVDRLGPPAQSVARGVFVPAPGPSSAVETPGQGHPTRRINLPTPPTALLGRDLEVAAIAARLRRADVRLVTLTGPGGIGKTHLSLQVAADLVTEFADGVFFVDLAPLRDPQLVSTAIAETLGIWEAGTQPILATLKEQLRRKHMLLLLDNFEQVLDAAPLVAELLASTAQLKCLATSREVLHLRGEYEVAVPPLALPDPTQLPALDDLSQYAAVALFRERVQASQPSFQVTSANAAAVAEICVRLDGLPLAIELAAARGKLFPPEALLARLSSRLALLTGGPRDLPARQRTLRHTIDWSYQLLTAGEQTLFARLAVFVGGCTLEAAEAVLRTEGGRLSEESALSVVSREPLVIDGLAALVDKSLLRQVGEMSGEMRFVMLETIRDYALEQLEASGEQEMLQQRHADYFVTLAETTEPGTTGAGRRSWWKRLEAEHDNLRATLAWTETQPAHAETMLRLAAALSQFWWWHAGEGVDWIHRALRRTEGPAMTGQSPAPALMLLRARVLFEAAQLASYWGDQRADADANESLALYEALGDPSDPGFAAALMAAGHAAQDAETSIALWERSVAMYRALGDDINASDVLVDLGHLARRQGKYAQSEVFYTEALDLAQTTHGELVRARLLEQMGALALHQQAPSRAVSMLEESVRLLRGRPGPEGAISLAWALIHLAEARRVVGETLKGAGSASDDQESIRRLCEEGLHLHHAWEARASLGVALLEIGELEYEQGDDARAASHLRESVVALRDLDTAQHLGWTVDAIGALVAVGSHPDALPRAVRLWSAATKLHQNRPRMSPVRRDRYERTFGAARTQLGEGPYAAAWAEGQTMSLEQAVADALRMLAEPPVIADGLLDSAGQDRTRSSPQVVTRLTARESEVLGLVAEGYLDQEVAARLGLRPRTVSSYLTSIYAKLEVRTRTAAVHIARDEHLI